MQIDERCACVCEKKAALLKELCFYFILVNLNTAIRKKIRVEWAKFTQTHTRVVIMLFHRAHTSSGAFIELHRISQCLWFQIQNENIL